MGEFLGAMNKFEGIVQDEGHVKTDLGVVHCKVPDGAAREVIVAIRPEDIYLSRDPSGLNNEFPAQLVSQLFLGDVTVYQLSANGKKMRGKTTRADRQLGAGGSVYVRFPAEKLKIFPRQNS